MSDFNTLELLTDPRGFATLWLSREEKNNAFNAEMIRELIIALDKVASDASLRFLIVRGRGKHFSAGADLAWMQQSAELDYATNLDDARELAELMYNLAKLKIPTLAVVQGAAFGGAFFQKTRVIVNVHREQARSYNKKITSGTRRSGSVRLARSTTRTRPGPVRRGSGPGR